MSKRSSTSICATKGSSESVGSSKYWKHRITHLLSCDALAKEIVIEGL